MSLCSALLPLMSAAAASFGAPTISGDATCTSKYRKLAQRVEATMNTYCLNLGTPKKAKNLDPRLLLVSPKNRDGAPPNVPHVHQLLKDFKQHGFARTRPAVGICVEVHGEEKQALIEYNKKFTAGNRYLPPIEEAPVMYASLACSHLNLALRCIKAGTQSHAGDLKTILEGQKDLEDVVANGHEWWILRAECPAQETHLSQSGHRPLSPSGHRPLSPSGHRPLSPSGHRPSAPLTIGASALCTSRHRGIAPLHKYLAYMVRDIYI